MFGFEADALHPMTIHFPIALLTMSFVFDFGGIISRKESLNAAGFWCLLTGVASFIPAVVTGFWADESYGHMDDPFPIYSTHGSMQILGGVLFLGLLVWRLRQKSELPARPLVFAYLALNSLIVALVSYGAHLGAILGERI
ncbi:MAG: DUF2231 domain-containing protein [Myxococcota bacterium]|nr:DUF2231 domain-containing protein [Myxococcota bacterium]